MGILSWIIFGALAGWVASMIAGTNREMGWLENIIVGIVGAFIAGWLFPRLGFAIGGGILGSIINATIGAVILLLLVKILKRA